MYQSIKQLGYHSFVYGLGNMLSKLLGFFLLPIYTRYLTPADYGILALLTLTQSILVILANLGLGSALFREVIYKKTTEKTAESTALYTLFILSLFILVIGYIFAPLLSRIIFNDVAQTPLLRLVFLNVVFNNILIVFNARLRIREQSLFYSIFSVSSFLVGAGLNIYFVAIARRGVNGLILAQVILAALQAFVCLLMLRDLIKPHFSKSVLRSLLNFGLPLVPGAIAALMMVSADRYILNRYSTTTMVGLYSLGYSIGLVINLIVQAVQLAWPAQLFEIAKLPDAKQRFSMTLTYYCLALGFISLTVSVLAREILVIMTTPEFYGAYIIMPLITLSYVFYGIRFMTTVGMYIKNKVKYSSFVIISAAIFNLFLSFILIPRFGMIGAAWATFISYFLLAVVNIFVDSRFMQIPYEYWRLMKIMAIWLLMFGLSLLISTPSTWINLILKTIWLMSYPFLLFIVRFYNHQEIQFIKDFLTHKVLRANPHS